MNTTELNELKSKMPIGMADNLHALLGCTWGHTIGVALNEELMPCQEAASNIMIIHSGTVEIPVKLCPQHIAEVEELTDPHKETP